MTKDDDEAKKPAAAVDAPTTGELSAYQQQPELGGDRSSLGATMDDCEGEAANEDVCMSDKADNDGSDKNDNDNNDHKGEHQDALVETSAGLSPDNANNSNNDAQQSANTSKNNPEADNKCNVAEQQPQLQPAQHHQISQHQQKQHHHHHHHHHQRAARKQHQQMQATQAAAATTTTTTSAEQVPISADYLAQLIKDKKQLSAFPSVFIHVQRLIDEEINKVRQSLLQLSDVVHQQQPLELPEPEGEFVQLQEKIYVPVGEHPEYNFVGRLLGPRGMTAKQLEQETGCKIMIRGRGSMRDKKKVSIDLVIVSLPPVG